MIVEKLKNTSGETLIETLVALAITCLGLLLLPGAIVAAARTNHAAEKYSFYAPQEGEAQQGQSQESSATDGTISIDGVPVKVNIKSETRGTGENKITYYSYSLPRDDDSDNSSDNTGD